MNQLHLPNGLPLVSGMFYVRSDCYYGLRTHTNSSFPFHARFTTSRGNVSLCSMMGVVVIQWRFTTLALLRNTCSDRANLMMTSLIRWNRLRQTRKLLVHQNKQWPIKATNVVPFTGVWVGVTAFAVLFGESSGLQRHQSRKWIACWKLHMEQYHYFSWCCKLNCYVRSISWLSEEDGGSFFLHLLSPLFLLVNANKATCFTRCLLRGHI